MSPYVIAGLDPNTTELTSILQRSTITLKEIESKRRNIDMLEFKAIVYNLKNKGIHEAKIATLTHRHRTDVLHHFKAFKNLLEIGDKKAIAINNRLNLD